MTNTKSTSKKFYQNSPFIFSLFLLLLTLSISLPISETQSVKESNSSINYSKVQTNISYIPEQNDKKFGKLINLSQVSSISFLEKCFTRKNETTLIKKNLSNSSQITEKLCQESAESFGYKKNLKNESYYQKCFPLCESCSSSGTLQKMNCLSCPENFTLNNQTTNCQPVKIFNKTPNIKFENKTLAPTPDKKSNPIPPPKKSPRRRKMIEKTDYEDYVNTLIEREDQSSLPNDRNLTAYNFHISLHPYYLLSQRCVKEGYFFIEDSRCVPSCTPQLETYFNYPKVEMTINNVTVCDCSFRCCKKNINGLSKSLDRGFIDGSYQYFRRQDGACLYFDDKNYYNKSRVGAYLLAQDFIPCYMPIYSSGTGEKILEYYISGYNITSIGNNCPTPCPANNWRKAYYYNEEKRTCHLCRDECKICDDVPTESHGHCIKCRKNNKVILDGSCIDICPLFYGNKNGFCVKCQDEEIYMDGYCLKYVNDIYNYGNSANPSFIDESNPKIFHRCMEYIDNETYSYSKGVKSVCDNIICPKGFYDNNENLCKKCPKGCIDCSKSQTEKITCSTCSSNAISKELSCLDCSFYVQVDINERKCYSKCPEDYQYFLREEDAYSAFDLDNLESEESASGRKCQKSCYEFGEYTFINEKNICRYSCGGDDLSFQIEGEQICLEECTFDYPQNEEGICENCKLEGKYNYNGTCIIPDEKFNEIYYILPGEENEKYGRVGSCFSRDEKGDYHPNKEAKILNNFTQCTDDCPSNYKKSVDENGDTICIKCYETCKTCLHTGDIGNHKCIECKDGYEFSSRLYGVCDEKCDSYKCYYYNEYLEKKCVDTCPPQLQYMSPSPDMTTPSYPYKCVKNCDESNQLTIFNTTMCANVCPPENKYEFDRQCYSKCPNDTGTVGTSTTCTDCRLFSLFFYNGICYDPNDGIPLGKYFSEKDSYIHDCFEQDPKSNEIVITGYYRHYSNCSKICPEDYYYEENLCYKCSDLCAYCDLYTKCSNTCPEGYKFDTHFKCAKTCPPDSPYIYDLGDYGIYCVENCYSSDEKVIFYSGNEEDGTANYLCTDDVTCPENTYLKEKDSIICYNETSIPKNKFYDPNNILEGKDKILSDCFIKIDDNEYFTGNFYPISNCEQKCPQYFFYEGNNKCKRCHANCESCFDGGTDESNNCNSCIDTENKILNPYLFNCEKKCKGNFSYDDITKKIVCENNCDKFTDFDSRDCVENCNNFVYGKYCYKQCPEGTVASNGNCIEKTSTSEKKMQTTEKIPTKEEKIETTEKKIPTTEKKVPTTEKIPTNEKISTTEIKISTTEIKISTTEKKIPTTEKKEKTESDKKEEEEKEKSEISQEEKSNYPTTHPSLNPSDLTEKGQEKNNSPEENSKSQQIEKEEKEFLDAIKDLESNFPQSLSHSIQTSGGNVSLSKIYPNDIQSLENFSPDEYSSNSIDLREIGQKLSETYPDEPFFYYLQVDIEEQKSSNTSQKFSSQIKYKIYTSDGKEINITEISSESEKKIITKKQISYTGFLENNTEAISDLAQKGVNVFDVNDPFFIDKCYPYQDENGNDIPLKNRIEDYYQNVTVCTYGCEYLGIEPKTTRVLCKCNASSLSISSSSDSKENQILGYVDENLMPGISDIVHSENLDVIYCYKQSYKKENLRKNIGFWLYLGFLLLMLLLFFILLCYSYPALYAYLFQFSASNAKQAEENEYEEEIIQKEEEVVVSSSSQANQASQENHTCQSNPPKSSKENSIEKNKNCEENKEKSTEYKTCKAKYSINKNQREYPLLNVSSFGEGAGYKLSNNIDVDTIVYTTPKKYTGDRKARYIESSNEKTGLNSFNSNSNSNNNLTNNNYSSIESGDNHITYKYSKEVNTSSPKMSMQNFQGSQVQLEPEGALLAANNFFDTCKIVNLKSKNQTIENQERGGRRFGGEGNGFFSSSNQVVNLPGFPSPDIENIESYYKESKKNDNRNNDINSNNYDDNSDNWNQSSRRGRTRDRKAVSCFDRKRRPLPYRSRSNMNKKLRNENNPLNRYGQKNIEGLHNIDENNSSVFDSESLGGDISKNDENSRNNGNEANKKLSLNKKQNRSKNNVEKLKRKNNINNKNKTKNNIDNDNIDNGNNNNDNNDDYDYDYEKKNRNQNDKNDRYNYTKSSNHHLCSSSNLPVDTEKNSSWDGTSEYIEEIENEIQNKKRKYYQNQSRPITINKYYISSNNSNFNEKENISSNSAKEYTKSKKKRQRQYPCRNIEKLTSEENKIISTNLKDSNNFKTSQNNKNNTSKNLNKKTKITTITKKKQILKKNSESIINSSLDDADFDEVVFEDHRSLCGIYLSFLSNRQIFMSVCLSDDIYVPWVMRAIICLFTLVLFFTLTALLMKESQIEKRYKSKKSVDILYLIQNEFKNIIYTTLIVKIMNFVASFIYVHYYLTKVIKDFAYLGDIFVREMKNAFYRLRRKFYIFTVVFIILICLQWYYISCFCYVYAGSQREWIICSCISFVFNLILSFFILFIAAMFRAMAICCESWLLFQISVFLISFA